MRDVGCAVIEVTLPWPPKELNPNARVYWSKKAKAAKAYREDCFYLARQIDNVVIFNHSDFDTDRKLNLWLTFYPPDRRARDDDNMLASFKSGRDGLAAALGIDDKRFISHIAVSDQIGGMVKVRVTV